MAGRERARGDPGGEPRDGGSGKSIAHGPRRARARRACHRGTVRGLRQRRQGAVWRPDGAGGRARRDIFLSAGSCRCVSVGTCSATALRAGEEVPSACRPDAEGRVEQGAPDVEAGRAFRATSDRLPTLLPLLEELERRARSAGDQSDRDLAACVPRSRRGPLVQGSLRLVFAVGGGMVRLTSNKGRGDLDDLAAACLVRRLGFDAPAGAADLPDGPLTLDWPVWICRPSPSRQPPSAASPR